MVLSYKLYSCRLACIPDEKCMQGPSILSYQVIRARKGLFKLPEVIVLSNDTHNLQYSTVLYSTLRRCPPLIQTIWHTLE